MIAELSSVSKQRFHDEILPAGEPVVIRGVAADWPAVRAARSSSRTLADYLARFDRGRPLGAMLGPPRIKGRLFYNDDLSGFNFKKQTVKLCGALDFLLDAEGESEPPAFAIQSAQVWSNLPGFETENVLPLLDASVEPRVWIGNQVTVAAHHDPSENIACVVAGRRRFTLFPPEQIGNLYMGPFERTPAGTTISMVDFDAPDLDRYPRFADALAASVTAELAPGDAIYIPYMWWHHVRSLDRFNMLVNYWWKPDAADKSHPMDALLHAMLTIRDLPETHRRAWRAHFDHYAFGRNGAPAAHLPPGQRGVLGELDEEKRRGLREAVAKGLERG